MSDGWDGILDDGETILWQGQPRRRFATRLSYTKEAGHRRALGQFLFYLDFECCAVRWLFLDYWPAVYWQGAVQLCRHPFPGKPMCTKTPITR